MATAKLAEPKELELHTLYEDKFCKVTKDNVIINCYYFPSTKKKLVKIQNINTICYEPQNSDFLGTKGWGMSLSPVWWAKDISRQFGGPYTNVVLNVSGEKIGKGFSVENMNSFLSVLYPKLGPNVKIVNKIP